MKIVLICSSVDEVAPENNSDSLFYWSKLLQKITVISCGGRLQALCRSLRVLQIVFRLKFEPSVEVSNFPRTVRFAQYFHSITVVFFRNFWCRLEV